MAADAPHFRVMRLISGYWLSQAVYVAAKLGLADLVADGSKSVDELASLTGTHPEALYRLLRALASVGVFREEAGRFAQTDESACLRTGPATQRALAIMNGEEHYRAYGELLHSVRTGAPAFDKVYGEGVFDWLGKHPEAAATFDLAMVGVHGTESAAIAEGYDFSGIRTLVDVGGGNGSLLSAIKAKWPHLKGVLFDLPHVVERASLPDGCERVAGSFFDSVPAGGEAYLMRHIIHDWDEPRCLTILGHIRKTGGKVLVAEGVVPVGNGPSFTKLLDLTMLAIPGGKERTEAEYADLFGRVGFKLARIVPTRSEVSVIEGVPA
ncbi:MAG: methyltransferase [Gemmataceae bacterium]|nr:methyltransferase [Gemmataceae bacterium]